MHALIDVYTVIITVASIFVCFANESSLGKHLAMSICFILLKYLLSTMRLHHCTLFSVEILSIMNTLASDIENGLMLSKVESRVHKGGKRSARVSNRDCIYHVRDVCGE